MEFTIKQLDLKKALSVIGGCIEKKNLIPYLQNVLIESLGENNIRITATDIDTTARFDVAADIKKPGKLCINGEKLSTIAPTLPDGDVSFKKDANAWAIVEAGKSTKMRIAGVDPKDFPEMAVNKSTPISLKVADLTAMIGRTIFCTSQEASRFQLNAIKLEIGDKSALMASTDTMRLSLANWVTDTSESFEVIIPRKAALEIMKIEAETVKVGEDQNHIFVEADGFMLTARKVSGNFPNYEMIIPKNNDLSFSCDVGDMKQAIRRCGMFATLDVVRCDLSAGLAMLGAKSTESGDIEDSVEVEYAGPDMAIGFNWPHLMDFLNLAGDGRMTVLFNENPNVPALLTAENLPDYQYILVLVNLPVVDAKKAAPAEPVKAKSKK